MSWDMDFITEEQFREHVKNTIKKYGEKLEPYDIQKFNKNIIDPIKLLFDKSVYQETWREVFVSEIFRQRDKSNNNEIGYFHQRIFQYIKNCRVPPNGQEGGWDVIYQVPEGYTVVPGNVVHTIFSEVKNKHNTMNGSAGPKTYIKMQNQLLRNDDCCCFLVEAIAKKSQNVIWQTTVDKQKVSHVRIRRVSIDKFYEIVTGDKYAFWKICKVLPSVIDDVVNDAVNAIAPKDTVVEEMQMLASKFGDRSGDTETLMALYMLGFSTYEGFKEYFEKIEKERS